MSDSWFNEPLPICLGVVLMCLKESLMMWTFSCSQWSVNKVNIVQIHSGLTEKIMEFQVSNLVERFSVKFLTFSCLFWKVKTKSSEANTHHYPLRIFCIWCCSIILIYTMHLLDLSRILLDGTCMPFFKQHGNTYPSITSVTTAWIFEINASRPLLARKSAPAKKFCWSSLSMRSTFSCVKWMKLINLRKMTRHFRTSRSRIKNTKGMNIWSTKSVL